VGTPLPDSKSELPPVIRRTELVAFALVGLLLICVFAVLYVAKPFFLPVVTAFVVGTMLAPAAYFLERHRIPRWVAAILIVSAAGAAFAFIVGLLSSPLMEWSTRLPELGSLLTPDHARRVGYRLISNAETRLDPADHRVLVADFHRVSAVLRDVDSVHRKLEGPAPRIDPDLR
jgi:predicted PurR-regulated permease PerM